MGMTVGLAVFVSGILATTLARVFADEFKAWMPWVAERFVRKAVAGLPEDQRERFGEEWRSHLNEIPGEIGKLVVAFGFIFAAWKMSSILKIEHSRGWVRDGLKRTVDVSFSVAGLFLLAPLLLAFATLIKLGSPGPILSRRLRIGLNGRQFYCYKLRTQTVINGVPKVTNIGRFLRKYSCDELPELLNVLRGDMTLVGPRPGTPEFHRFLNGAMPGSQERNAVKPGITGWAQVNDTVHPETYLANDLYYVQNRSLKLDLNILVKTVWKNLFRSKQ
jgi:lipopolysaccharide/colanic/teichoic acid biosynthesis glycosyltransferase